MPEALPERPAVNAQLVDRRLGDLRLIAPKFIPHGWPRNDKQFLLSDKDLLHITVEKRGCSEPFEWIDISSGREGIGAVALVAHVYRVSSGEAAYRAARFLSAAANVPMKYLVVEAEQ
jgi:hypothetical protein